MRSRLTATVIAATIMIGAGALIGGGGIETPAPIVGQGYSLVWHDEFDSFTSNGDPWYDHVFFQDPVPGNMSASGGILTITNSKTCTGGTANGCVGGSDPGWYYSADASTGNEWGADGGPCGGCYQFGYLEARMKATNAQGSWPAFWLISYAHSAWINWPDCPEPDLNYELDIIEWLGSEPDTYYGTQHRNTNGVCSTPDESQGVSTAAGTNLMADWHTYAVKWTASNLTWYFDGVQQGSPSTIYDSGDQMMSILLTMQACGWEGNECDGTTPNDLVLDVDWVRVWQQ